MRSQTNETVHTEGKTNLAPTSVPLLAQHLLKRICDKKEGSRYIFSWPRGKQG
jgi:hypothetical protein